MLVSVVTALSEGVSFQCSFCTNFKHGLTVKYNVPVRNKSWKVFYFFSKEHTTTSLFPTTSSLRPSQKRSGRNDLGVEY